MKDGPNIASIAAMLGDPARANMLTALMEGRSLTASELAETAGVTVQTASGHLAKLLDTALVRAVRQGRHRYFCLSGPDVAQALEALMVVAQRTGAVRVRTGPKEAALREARICYDHLAGERGVALLQGLQRRGYLTSEGELGPTDRGRAFFSDIGIDTKLLQSAKRPLCRTCLDWSERRSHLGGALGAALLDHLFTARWVSRQGGRAVRFSPAGATRFAAEFA
jgi:DNA-binding transcriptional ArsR family regulator